MAGRENPVELASYIADHYGTCGLGSGGECLCQRPGNPWKGRGCPHWRPVPDQSWEGRLARLRSQN